jgi:hypothetical protein
LGPRNKYGTILGEQNTSHPNVLESGGTGSLPEKEVYQAGKFLRDVGQKAEDF